MCAHLAFQAEVIDFIDEINVNVPPRAIKISTLCTECQHFIALYHIKSLYYAALNSASDCISISHTLNYY